MSENSHAGRHSMIFEDREELKSLHFKSYGGINDQQGQITDFGSVYHPIDIIGALNESDPVGLIRPDSNGPLNVINLLLCVVIHKRLNQSRLSTF